MLAPITFDFRAIIPVHHQRGISSFYSLQLDGVLEGKSTIYAKKADSQIKILKKVLFSDGKISLIKVKQLCCQTLSTPPKLCTILGMQ
jgi:hypothetical protein